MAVVKRHVLAWASHSALALCRAVNLAVTHVVHTHSSVLGVRKPRDFCLHRNIAHGACKRIRQEICVRMR